MIIRLPIVSVLLAVLLCAALAPHAQPDMDEAWLTIHIYNADGTPVTTMPSISIADTNGSRGGNVDSAVNGNALLLTGLSAGDDYQLAVIVMGVVAIETRTITMNPGENILDWRLPPSATLTIKVATADGQDLKTPLTFAFTNAAGNIPLNIRTASSAGNISTFADIYPGDYQVMVTQGTSADLDVRKVTVTPGANTLDWVLPPAATVTFHVTPAENSAALTPPVSLTLLRPGSTGKVLNATAPLQQNTATFTCISAGDYTAQVRVGNRVIAERAITLQPGEHSLDWALPPLCSFTVHFLLHDSQLPAAMHLGLTLQRGTDVSLTGTPAQVNGTLTVNYDQIPAGVYQGALIDYNIGDYNTGGLIDERELTIAPGEQTFEWTLPAFPTVTGILTADGKPVTPTQGVALYSTSPVPSPLVKATATFADGHYTIAEVPPGGKVQIVLLTDAGWGVATVEAKMGAGTVDAPMTLKPGGTLAITNVPFGLTTGANHVPGFAVLTWKDPGAPMLVLTYQADADGKVVIPFLPPGNWHYQTSDADAGQVVTGDVTIVAGKTETVSAAPQPPPPWG